MNEPKDYEYLLLCDGSTISEENYPELVAVLGGTQLPNLIDRFLQGSATAGRYIEAGLPNITGSFNLRYMRTSTSPTSIVSSPSGVISTEELDTNNLDIPYSGSYSISKITKVALNASRSNGIYGNSTTVQPPAYTAKIYICYAG